MKRAAPSEGAGREEKFTTGGASGTVDTVQLRKALADGGDAIAPVVGIALLLGITVLLVVTVGAFVTGTLSGASPADAPDADFSFRYFNQSAADPSTTSTEGDRITIRHAGGTAVEASNLGVATTGAKLGDGTTPSGTPSSPFTGTVEPGTEVTLNDSAWSASFTGSGNRGPAGDLNYASATVRVVWSSPDGDNSAVLASWTGPKA